MTALTGNEIGASCIDQTTAVDLETQVQPAGIDMTLQKVEGFIAGSHGVLDFDNSRRRLPEMGLIPFDIRDRVFLNRGVYIITLDPVTTVPLDCVGIAKPRSSLFRMGANIVSAMWDPGYKGESKVLLEVKNPAGIELYKNARVAQLMFMKLEQETFSYDGVYQGSGLGPTKAV